MQKNGIGSKENTDKQAERKKSRFFLFAVYFVVYSAFFDTHAQMPVLAPYAISLGAGPFILGIVVGSYSLFNIAGNFTGGLVIDRISWRFPLFSGLAGIVIILLFYTFAGSAYYLIMVRAAHGFLGGILVPAALASLIGKGNDSVSQRPRLAIFGATIGIAAITGPLVAGFIAGRYGYHPVYYFLAVLMFTAAITAFFILPNPRATAGQNVLLPISFRQLYSNPQLRGAFIFALGTMGATGTLATFLPVRTGILGLSHAQTGMLFASFALTAVFVQMLWPGILRGFIRGDCRGCVWGQFFLATALIMAALWQSLGCLFAALIIYGLGFGLSFQGMLGLVMEGSQTGWRGRAIGIYFAFYSFGAAVVPPLGGLLWQYIPSLFPFYTSAAFAIIVLIYGKKLISNND